MRRGLATDVTCGTSGFGACSCLVADESSDVASWPVSAMAYLLLSGVMSGGNPDQCTRPGLRAGYRRENVRGPVNVTWAEVAFAASI